MLSTTAKGLYWLSRFLERAEFSARLLSTQLETLEDRTVQKIDESWKRVYRTLRLEPVGGFQPSQGDEWFMLTDSFTLTDHLIFDTDNYNSIKNCITSGRENARAVRNVIGSEMWSQINAIHLDLKSVEITTIWHDQPRKFLHRLGHDLRSLSGITDNTLYRDHGWHFSQLGRFIERTQQIVSLMSAPLSTDEQEQRLDESSWIFILKVCQARLAYSRLYSLLDEQSNMIRFVMADPSLPNSVLYSLRQISKSLAVIAHGHFSSNSAKAMNDNRWMIEEVQKFESSNNYDAVYITDFLNELLKMAYQLHNDLTIAFFDYDLESYMKND